MEFSLSKQSPSKESIETLSALEIAEQMTYLDHQIFLAIRSEYVSSAIATYLIPSPLVGPFFSITTPNPFQIENKMTA
jgi:hypothetical protein